MYTNASELSGSRSKSLLMRRFWSSQENVLSTTHLLGRTVKAGRGGDSWSAGTQTHRLGGLTTSTLKPNAFWTQSLPFPLPRCSRHRATDERGAENAPQQSPSAPL